MAARFILDAVLLEIRKEKSKKKNQLTNLKDVFNTICF